MDQKLQQAAQPERQQTNGQKPQPAVEPTPQPAGGATTQPAVEPTKQAKADEPLEFKPGDVRVNISVMSANKSEVFYIARAEGSAAKNFGKRSVAWVSVFTGRIRWYRESYRILNVDGTKAKKLGDSGPLPEGDMFSKIVLFDNQDGTIADDETTIFLKSHFQPRGQDYKAFVVFPVPWPRRAYTGDYVRGAIHISFRNEAQFDYFWNQGSPASPLSFERLNSQSEQFGYTSEDKLLGEYCQDDELRAVLNHAVAVLSNLLRGFNENVYKYSGSV